MGVAYQSVQWNRQKRRYDLALAGGKTEVLTAPGRGVGSTYLALCLHRVYDAFLPDPLLTTIHANKAFQNMVQGGADRAELDA